jgi:ABC-type Mn2+/Zn2+ transport system ATPase subunit
LTTDEGLIVTLIGENGGKKTNISSVTITGQKRKAIDFSAIFKKPTEKFETILFDLKMMGK